MPIQRDAIYFTRTYPPLAHKVQLLNIYKKRREKKKRKKKEKKGRKKMGVVRNSGTFEKKI